MPAFPYESCFQRIDQEFVMTQFANRAAKGSKFSGVFFYGTRNGLGLPRGGGRLLQHGQASKLVTVLGNFSAKGDLCGRRRDAKPPQDVTAESGERAELAVAWV
jgi:hypothetical protein